MWNEILCWVQQCVRNAPPSRYTCWGKCQNLNLYITFGVCMCVCTSAATAMACLVIERTRRKKLVWPSFHMRVSEWSRIYLGWWAVIFLPGDENRKEEKRQKQRWPAMPYVRPSSTNERRLPVEQEIPMCPIQPYSERIEVNACSRAVCVYAIVGIIHCTFRPPKKWCIFTVAVGERCEPEMAAWRADENHTIIVHANVWYFVGIVHVRSRVDVIDIPTNCRFIGCLCIQLLGLSLSLSLFSSSQCSQTPKYGVHIVCAR